MFGSRHIIGALLVVLALRLDLQGEELPPLTLADTARRDWASIPVSDQNYIRYLVIPDTSADDPFSPDQEDYTRALAFLLPSCSRAINLDRQIPHQVAPGVLRIDLRDYGWSPIQWIKATAHHPYSQKVNSLIVRGDWLLHELSDADLSPAYYRLLLDTDGLPTSLSEALRLLEVQRERTRSLGLNFGSVETESGVALNKIRLLEFFSREGGYAAGTRDFFKITATNSPLELIDQKGLQHDASEWIVGLPKVWTDRRPRPVDPHDIRGVRHFPVVAGRGSLQVYLLADGKDRIQTEAPMKIVEDHTRFRGIASIRAPGSCVQCHTHGLNEPTRNGLKEVLEHGVELKSYDPQARDYIERFHLTDSGKYILRANEDYAAAIKACNGLTPEQNRDNFKLCIDSYRVKVTLEVAAAELYCTPAELRNAIAYASESKQKVGVHVAGLAHGIPLARDTWETVHFLASEYLHAWRQNQ